MVIKNDVDNNMEPIASLLCFQLPYKTTSGALFKIILSNNIVGKVYIEFLTYLDYVLTTEKNTLCK